MMVDSNNFLYPEEKFKARRLTGNSPCVDCLNMHRYHKGTAIMSEPVDTAKCIGCIDLAMYKTDCITKLSWYEDNDDKVNKLSKKNRYIYDCGVKCPQSTQDGYPITYPNGWIKKNQQR